MKNLKNEKTLKILLIVLSFFLIVVGVFLIFNSQTQNEKDNIPRLEDDFYESINYETLKNAKIPADSGVWSRSEEADKKVEERINTIAEEILSDPNYKNESMDIELELYNDYAQRNKLGISELQPYFDMIESANTIEEFNNIMIKLDRDLNVSVLIEYSDIDDIYDKSKTVLAFDHINIAGKDIDAFDNKKYGSIAKYHEKRIRKYFEILGYSNEKIENIINEMKGFAKTIQEKSISEDDFDIENNYIKLSLDEFTKDIKNLPIKKLLISLKLAEEEFYVVLDLGQIKAIDEYYTIENLPLLKEIAKINILHDYIGYTTEENELILLNFANEEAGITRTIESYREERNKLIQNMYIAYDVQKRYDEKYFSEKEKENIINLIEEIKEYYKEVITNCSWLSSDTKQEAIKKIDTMKVIVGYDEIEKSRDYYKPISKDNGGTIISNKINENRDSFEKYNELFHKNSELETLSTLDVNAAYFVNDNSIIFTAGFKSIYENESDYYKLLGYFGTVIGHEISHAFDNTGSKFDEQGNFRDWWSKEDKENYESLTKKIIDYYSKYEIMGFKVNGKKTLGENIADLASMKVMISIAEKNGATNDDYKKLFESYADLYAEKRNKELLENQILTDEHSPNKIRVNAVLSSMDKFYEVYDIKEGDKMYVPKEDRVGLW